MFQSPLMPQKTFQPMRKKQPLAQSISRSDMPTLHSLTYLANRAFSYRGNAQRISHEQNETITEL